jgi:hypothetical protein
VKLRLRADSLETFHAAKPAESKLCRQRNISLQIVIAAWSHGQSHSLSVGAALMAVVYPSKSPSNRASTFSCCAISSCVLHNSIGMLVHVTGQAYVSPRQPFELRPDPVRLCLSLPQQDGRDQAMFRGRENHGPPLFSPGSSQVVTHCPLGKEYVTAMTRRGLKNPFFFFVRIVTRRPCKAICFTGVSVPV